MQREETKKRGILREVGELECRKNYIIQKGGKDGRRQGKEGNVRYKMKEEGKYTMIEERGEEGVKTKV